MGEIKAFTLPEIAERAGAEYRTLKSWVDRGLVMPSVHAAGGGIGRRDLYSQRDADVICTLADLRRRGLDFDHIEVVARLLANHDQAECTVCGGTISMCASGTGVVVNNASKETAVSKAAVARDALESIQGDAYLWQIDDSPWNTPEEVIERLRQTARDGLSKLDVGGPR